MLTRNATIIMMALATVAGCRSATAPYASDPSGPVGDGPGTGYEWIRGTNTINVGNNMFTSAYTGTTHPAVDTVALTSTMTWKWTRTGQVAHSVQSMGATTFPSSGILVGEGTSYTVQFTTPGTYQYDCAVHGEAMTGTIVVLPEM